MNTAVIIVGVGVLLVLAYGIGMSTDTEGRRVLSREVARERRERREELLRLREERWRLYTERRGAARRNVTGCPNPNCPSKDSSR